MRYVATDDQVFGNLLEVFLPDVTVLFTSVMLWRFTLQYYSRNQPKGPPTISAWWKYGALLCAFFAGASDPSALGFPLLASFVVCLITWSVKGGGQTSAARRVWSPAQCVLYFRMVAGRDYFMVSPFLLVLLRLHLLLRLRPLVLLPLCLSVSFYIYT